MVKLVVKLTAVCVLQAGLGRTGTLIAVWMMKHHGFTANEASSKASSKASNNASSNSSSKDDCSVDNKHPLLHSIHCEALQRIHCEAEAVERLHILLYMCVLIYTDMCVSLYTPICVS